MNSESAAQDWQKASRFVPDPAWPASKRAAEIHALARHMREGAKRRPGIKQRFFGPRIGGNLSGSCALGAAFESRNGGTPAEGYDPNLASDLAWLYHSIASYFPVLAVTMNPASQCQGCTAPSGSLYKGIFHMNDDHDFTREAIADWLDKIADRQED